MISPALYIKSKIDRNLCYMVMTCCQKIYKKFIENHPHNFEIYFF